MRPSRSWRRGSAYLSIPVVYKDKKEWARSAVHTAGGAVRLAATPDRERIRADGKDLSFVSVRVTDKNGRMAPRAANRVRFSIEGPGEIVATDNGEQTDMEPFQAHDRQAFNGQVLVIVRGKPGQPGKLTVRADAVGLAPATVTVLTQ